MKAFFRIAFFVIGIVQFFAVWAGAEYFLDVQSFVGKVFAFAVSLFLTYVPLVGSAVGVYGATNVWDWSLTKSIILFFWYVPVFILFLGYSFISDRR
jgi:hypothetical protein